MQHHADQSRGIGDGFERHLNAKTIVQPLASGGTVEGGLAALQTELVNLAKLNGYQVE